MRVYCETPPDLSKAMSRVTAALKNHAPRRGVEFVEKEEDAELVVLHVIGYPETREHVVKLRARGQEYAVIQYCLRSTQEPDTNIWNGIWQQSKLVWSYYDLPKLCVEDGWTSGSFPFYLSPLGVDPVFQDAGSNFRVKTFTMMSTGYIADAEGVGEVAEAVKRVGGRHFHLGPKHVAPNADKWGLQISDFLLADVYSRCCWVAGLRRCEGFEMPAAEGLVCGARPIMFDAPHYRQWFDGFAEFIPEGDFESVVQSIVNIFERGFQILPDALRNAAADRFNWKKIIPGFWEGVL